MTALIWRKKLKQEGDEFRDGEERKATNKMIYNGEDWMTALR